jgi:hypothetical protein
MQTARITPHQLRWCLPVVLCGLALAISWPLAKHFSLVGRHRIALLVAAPAGVAVLATTLLCCRKRDTAPPQTQSTAPLQISISDPRTLSAWVNRTQHIDYYRIHSPTQREQIDAAISRYLLSQDPATLPAETLAKVQKLSFCDEPLQFDQILRVLQSCRNLVSCKISTLNNDQLDRFQEAGSTLGVVTICRANDLDPDRISACLKKWPTLTNLFLGCVTYPPETLSALQEGAGRGEQGRGKVVISPEDTWK